MTDDHRATPQAAYPVGGAVGAAGPTPPAERFVALDALRGLAVLGIFLVNIQVMARPRLMPGPAVGLGLEGLNYGVWLVTHLLFEQKFITLFSMMFGAGLVLLGDRQEAIGRSAGRRHARRSGWLLLIGLAHAYLIWYGDILVAYALCGLVVFWCRRWPSWALITTGLGLIAIPAGLCLLLALTVPFWPERSVEAFQQALRPSAAAFEGLIAQYRGGWLEQMPTRASQAFQLQTLEFLGWSFWIVTGLMLLGMALYKLGFLTGRAPSRVYWLLLTLGSAVGLPSVLIGVVYQHARPDQLARLFYGLLFNHGASVLVALGWASALMLVVRSRVLPWFTERLTATGRMALSNYLLQSLLGTLVFYGHGVGLYASVGWWEPVGIVVVVWILQLVGSRWWLARFRYGPVEWLWRSLTYGRRQRMREPAMPRSPLTD